MPSKGDNKHLPSKGDNKHQFDPVENKLEDASMDGVLAGF
jgi:hypothetical protein